MDLQICILIPNILYLHCTLIYYPYHILFCLCPICNSDTICRTAYIFNPEDEDSLFLQNYGICSDIFITVRTSNLTSLMVYLRRQSVNSHIIIPCLCLYCLVIFCIPQISCSMLNSNQLNCGTVYKSSY
jgi:hypothetical protein